MIVANQDDSGKLADPLDAVVRRAASGDAESLEALLVAVTPRLKGIVRRIFGGSYAEADDRLQEILVAICDALPAFEYRSTFSYYAARIATRHCVFVRQRQRVRDQLLETHLAQTDAPSGGFSRPEVQAIAAAKRELLSELLEGLPPAQRDSFALRWASDLSLDEVAAAMGVPVNTVRSRLRLAKLALIERMKANPAQYEDLYSVRFPSLP